MLSRLKKTSSFTKWMAPDELVPDIETAKKAGDELRRARPVRGSFSWVAPEKREKYELVGVSPACMKDLGLKEGEEHSEYFQNIMTGQELDQEVYPWAQAYAGWQFGEWAGQLGDGRAISLFEINTDKKRYEVQLKGAGLTPYSRFADGKAVVRSSVREMLGSEAVNALGIPTTRALSLFKLPGTTARRMISEECAIVARCAESWVRCGTFDLHQAKRNRTEMRQLADYCIAEVFNIEKTPNRYVELYRQICLKNARGLAMWQSYGVLNGVLNTDNTSVLGLFIDYGPFAFIDTFDSSYTPNHDDGLMRYAYKNVPSSMWWNLVRLGEDLAELLGAGDLVDDETFINEGLKREQIDGVLKRAEDTIAGMQEEFTKEFRQNYTSMMIKRLGLNQVHDTDHDEILTPLLDMLEECQLDYNHFFRTLGDYTIGESTAHFFQKSRDFAPNLTLEEANKELGKWLEKYQARLGKENLSNEDRRANSRAVNPKFVLRTWILDEVIQSVQDGKTDYFNQIMNMALHPFNETWGYDKAEEDRLTGEVPRSERLMQCSCSS